jgi:hypothetical protein
MTHDLPKLEQHLKTLDRRIVELAEFKLGDQMLAIIYKKGWTTLAEFALVSNAVQALTNNIETQIQQSKQLLEASKLVRPAEAGKSAA